MKSGDKNIPRLHHLSRLLGVDYLNGLNRLDAGQDRLRQSSNVTYGFAMG